MKVELPRANEEKERAEMEKAAKAMKKKRRKRIMLAGVLGALVSIVLFVSGYRIYTNLFVVMSTLVEPNGYEVTMHRLWDDRVVLLFDQEDDQLVCSKGAGQGNGIIDVHLYTSRIQQFVDAEQNHGGYQIWVIGEWKDGRLLSNNEQINKLYASGNIEETLIYTHGDEIPKASEELNRYIIEKDTPSNWHREDYEQMLTELRKDVPEMQ